MANIPPEESAGQALYDIIMATASASTPSPILLLLQTEDISNVFFQFMLASMVPSVLLLHLMQQGSSLVNGLPPFSLLFTLLSASGYETNTTMEELPALFHAVIAALPRFSEMLQTGEAGVVLSTSTGELAPPLGFSRLRICEFILAFIRTNFACVMDCFISSNIITDIIVISHFT